MGIWGELACKRNKDDNVLSGRAYVSVCNCQLAWSIWSFVNEKSLMKVRRRNCLHISSKFFYRWTPPRLLTQCVCRLIHASQLLMAHKNLIIAQTLFGGVNQGGVRGNTSTFNFSSVIKELRWHCLVSFLVYLVCCFFFSKLVREEPKLLTKHLYFLAVIITLLSWKGTKVWLHTEDKRKVGSLGNHSFLFIEHRSCFSTKLNLNAVTFQSSYPQRYENSGAFNG